MGRQRLQSSAQSSQTKQLRTIQRGPGVSVVMHRAQTVAAPK
jgi:hypothetical protein